MKNNRHKLAAFGAAFVCSALLTTVAAAAVTPPSSMFADAPSPRRPQRASTRATSLEWMPDVLHRLRTLEEHAADAARAPRRFRFDTGLLGRLHPRLPVAGDGVQQ